MSVLKAVEEGPRNVPAAQASEAEGVVIAVSWLKSLLRLGVRWMVHVALPVPACAEAAKEERVTMAEIPAMNVMVRRSLHVECFTEGLLQDSWARVARDGVRSHKGYERGTFQACPGKSGLTAGANPCAF